MYHPQPCLDHVSLGVADIARARAFYEPVLGTVGFRILHVFTPAIAFGDTSPVFWITRPFDDVDPCPGIGTHVSFRAPSRAAVCAFHAAGLAAGGSDAGPPGLRGDMAPTCFAAFLFDPDGNKIEAVCYAQG